jgi:hypothetical protein
MVDEAVSMTLEPESRRQLGEEGLVVFWRDGREPGLREGLACILSLCPHPDCACQLVYVDGFLIGGQASAVVRDQEGVHLEGAPDERDRRVTLAARMVAMVDPSSGDTRAHPDLPDVADPALLDWLASEMDVELLEVLHRYRAQAKGYPPEGPRKDIDLDEVEQYHLAAVDDLLDGTRSDEYILGGRRYWAAMFLCPTPWCDCHEARVVFFDDEAESGDAVGSVFLDLSGPSDFRIEEKTAECEPRQLLEDLWALFEQRHDVGRFLRHREAQLREVGDMLWQPVPKPATAASKAGRNAPCPCGSGRKYKKCCLGKNTALLDVGSAPRSQ